MDSNGSRLHLLLGRGDWGRCREENAQLTLGELWPESGISPDAAAALDAGEMSLRPELFRFEQPGAEALDLRARRGAAVDRFGTWFWVSEDRSAICAASAGARTTSLFWRPGIGSALRPARRRGQFARREAPAAQPAGAVLSGLAVTADHHLAVGLWEPKGLLVFDLQGGGAPLRLTWPEDVPFRAFDLSARRRGGVWILDAENRRLWELDRHFMVVSIAPASDRAQPAGAFRPAQPPAPPQPAPARSAVATPIRLEDSAALDGEPISVEAARDGTVLVLDRNGGASPSLVQRYRNGRPVGQPAALADSGLSVAVVAHDIALAGEDLGDDREPLGRLYAVSVSGNQAYAFRATVPGDQLTLKAVEAYLPLRSFGGRALAADGRRAYYDFADRFVPLAEQRRPRYVPEAVLVTPDFDGREPSCVWHRLLFDGCVPSETTVEVWSRTADEPELLGSAEWRREPAPQRRTDGSELPYAPSADEPRGTWELLLQHARGRHLQLRLRLAGDSRTSPRLRALRVYYPRFSYLVHYLPKLYREDAESASFLERFLANPEGINTSIEDRIAAAQILLDPDASPAEHLDWLAGWFELALGPDWDDLKRRRFVRHASRFLALRGTTPGLILALRLALEACVDDEAFERPEAAPGGPRIVERFRTRTLPPAALGDPTAPARPRVVPAGRRWEPQDGGDALDERFRLALQAAAGAASPDPAVVFPVTPPAGELAAFWREFCERELGFAPADDEPAWVDFLRARYGRIERLRTAYGAGGDEPEDFDAVALPRELPTDGVPLRDWYQFQAVHVPMRRSAHAFTVLLPVPVDESVPVDHEARRALATRVVTLQKPAHTVFDVRFFWSAFRVGEARLGIDTLIDLGSRSPALLTPLVLARGHLGEGVLGGGEAPRITRPPSAGRQPLAR